MDNYTCIGEIISIGVYLYGDIHLHIEIYI